MRVSKLWFAGLSLAAVLPFAATAAFADDGIEVVDPYAIGDYSLLQSEDVGGATFTDGAYSGWQWPCSHGGGFRSGSRVSSREVHATLPSGHELYEAVGRYYYPEDAPDVVTQLQEVYKNCYDGPRGEDLYTIKAKDQWGPGSTLMTHSRTGSDQTETILFAATGEFVFYLLETDSAGGLTTLTELAPKAIERLATPTPEPTIVPTFPQFPPLPPLDPDQPGPEFPDPANFPGPPIPADPDMPTAPSDPTDPDTSTPSSDPAGSDLPPFPTPGTKEEPGGIDPNVPLPFPVPDESAPSIPDAPLPPITGETAPTANPFPTLPTQPPMTPIEN